MSAESPRLTTLSVEQLAGHIGSQGHAMAGATIAASGALACSLGVACVRISILHMTAADEQAHTAPIADRLLAITGRLQALADEDGAAITAFAAARAAGQELQGQEQLCRMPVEAGQLAAEAALILQDFRVSVRVVQDDLEMAICLLDGVARAAALLLDSNLRLWPEAALLALFEPQLAELRKQVGRVQPVESVR